MLHYTVSPQDKMSKMVIRDVIGVLIFEAVYAACCLRDQQQTILSRAWTVSIFTFSI